MVLSANPLENVCEKLTHMHKMVDTWWCWHICKGGVVGVDLDQFGVEKEKKGKVLVVRGSVVAT